MPPAEFSNVKDVGGLLTSFEVARAHICGVSFGGLIALDFALAHPDRCLSLCVAGPSVSGAIDSDRIRAFWEEEEAALDRGDVAAAIELNLRMWVDGPHRTPRQSPPEVRERVRQMQQRIFEKDIPDEVDEIEPELPAPNRLSQLEIPLLVLVGSLDLPEKL